MFKTSPYLLLIYLFIPLLVINLLITSEQHFTLLASSFLNGQLDLNFAKYYAANLAYYNDNFYWPNGPFPAILLAPFVFLFGVNFLQGIVQFPLNVLNFALVYKISKLLGLSANISLLLAIFFVFGSVYTPVAAIPVSWYFAQVITTSALLLAIYEFLTKKRYLLIGLLLGLATLTRFTLILSSVFFLIYILSGPNKSKHFASFVFPIALAVVVVFAYNFARFDSIFEAGYRYQIVQEEAKQLQEGLFQLKNMPTNLYRIFFKPPDLMRNQPNGSINFPFIKYDNYGLSILILSPILLLIYKANFKDFMVKTSLKTILLVLIPILAYYGSGLRQIGARYALDFFPFLLIILASAAKKTNETKLKILIFSGVLITWFFIFEKLSGF